MPSSASIQHVNFPKVAIITVTYKNEKDVFEYATSLAKLNYPAESLRLFICDNNSQDGTVASLQTELRKLPFAFELTENATNLWFTGGNNQEFVKAAACGAKYVLLLNPDTKIDSDAVRILVDYLESSPQTAIAQPLILQLDDPTKINTSGNLLHFLGFGMVGENGNRADTVRSSSFEIQYASGAAMMLRVSTIEAGEPLFDPEYEAYHEDLELSWRLRLNGWKLVCVPNAKIFHRYSFQKGGYKFFLIERNRLRLLLTHYRIFTLILLAPFWSISESAILLMSVSQGWGREKLRAYREVMRSWRSVLSRRKLVQKRRKVRDGDIISSMSGDLVFPEGTPLPIAWVYNPLSRLYKGLISHFIV